MLDDHKLNQPTQPLHKKLKKRKVEIDDPCVKDLREKAKFYCKNITEWRVVCKYNKSRLEEYLHDQEFLASAKLSDQFSDVVTSVYAFIVDKMAKGDGFVEAEIKNDVSLRDCIHKELVDVLKIMTNKMQCVVFSLVDITQGKKRQYASVGHGEFNYHQRDSRPAGNVEVVEEGRGNTTATSTTATSEHGSASSDASQESVLRPGE